MFSHHLSSNYYQKKLSLSYQKVTNLAWSFSINKYNIYKIMNREPSSNCWCERNQEMALGKNVVLRVPYIYL